MPTSSSRKTPARQAYHHGDLRQAMLAAAGRLIEEQGLEKFTLRECARRAGVSHGAPAHHFGDVRGLLTALAAESFEQMQQEMVAHEAAAPPDPYAQLIANGQAYVAYAMANRGRFQLMFRSDSVDCEDPRLMETGRAAYGRLERHIDTVLAASHAGSGLQKEKSLLAWVIVHGLSTLTLENRLFDGDDEARLRTALSLVDLFMRMLQPGLEQAAPK